MEYFLFEKRGRVGILTVNRPKALNALCTPLLEELNRFLTAGIQAEQIRALIVTGAGKAFIAGGDIKEMLALTGRGDRALCGLGHDTKKCPAPRDKPAPARAAPAASSRCTSRPACVGRRRCGRRDGR